jgi:autotransporter-associated beta strand protein
MKFRLSPLGVMLGFFSISASFLQAQTTSLNILNPSFELQGSTASGTYSSYPYPYGITDWTDPVNVSGGTTFVTALVNIPAQGWTGDTQGENAFQFFNERAMGSAYIYQALSSEFVPGDTYTLTAGAAGSYAADFYIGTNSTPSSALATTSITTSTSQTLSQYSVSFTATSADAGANIVIGFYIPYISSSVAGDTIDNFQLTQTVPTSSYLWSNAPADGNLNNAANWAGGVVATTNTTLEFAASSVTTLVNNFTNDAPFTGLRFDSNASSYTIYGNAILLSGNSTINNSSNNETINVALDGIGGITQAGTGTLTLTASNSYAGGTTISDGTLAISNGGALGSSALNYSGNGTLSILTPLSLPNGVSLNNGITATINNNGFNVTNTGGIYGSGGVNFSGAGTLTLTQASTYTGPTTLNGSTLLFTNPNSPLGTGMITFASNSTLLNQGSAVSPTTGLPNAIEINSGATATLDPGANNPYSQILITGPISGAGGVSTVTSGPNNIVTFTANNSYSGGTTLNGGWMQYEGNSPFGSGTITVAGNTILRNLLSPTVNNPITINSGATLTLSNPDETYIPAYTGGVSGPGSLASGGVFGSTNFLIASNTYTGSTIISSGTLYFEPNASINGSTNINLGTQGSQSTLDLSSQQFYTMGTNQTLSGYGVINAPAISLNVNGKITPGSLDGTTRGLISVNGNLVLGSNSTTTLTLNSPGMAGIDYDSVVATGFLKYNGQLNLIVNNPVVGVFDLFGAGSFTAGLTGVALAGSWYPGPFSQGSTGIWSYTDHTFDWVFNENTGDLTVSLVPEPSTCTLLALGVLALGIAVRRRRRV